MEDVGGLLASLVLDDSITTGNEERRTENPSDLILLDGDIGAGKTALARGFIRNAFGDVDMQVTSPTYLLSNSYKTETASAGLEIQHMDLYRLTGERSSELIPLNLKHVFENCVTLIEWPQRLVGIELPTERLEIFISILPRPNPDHTLDSEHGDEFGRRAKITPFGKRWVNRISHAVEQGLLDDLLE
ncbi:hypothetical protein ACA910_010755 [Epithemia clementina (nom. ined.)]